MTLSLHLTRTGLLVLAASVALTACSGERKRRDQLPFEGIYFKSRAASTREDRRAFTVTVTPVSASLDGARAAGRYEATKYCLRAFGSSDIDWTLAPDAEQATLAVADDTLTLTGRCAG